jgi:uncharacterized membrane protein YidH (DUF202 family)
MRRIVGLLSAIGAVVALAIYVAALAGHAPLAGAAWPYFVGAALVFLGGTFSYRALLPHYKIQQVVQLHKLRPFFSPLQYASVLLVFSVTIVGVVVGGAAVGKGLQVESAMNQVFGAGLFGALYTNALILLYAKAPRSSVA